MDFSQLIVHLKTESPIVKAVFSVPISVEHSSRIDLRPVTLSGELFYQAEWIDDKKALHKNISNNDLDNYLQVTIKTYKNAVFFTENRVFTCLTSKKGKLTVIAKNLDKSKLLSSTESLSEASSHNRQKNHILSDGDQLPFLVKLGIMDEAYKVKPSRYDKFIQLNKFLEIAKHCVQFIPKNVNINVTDYGCGKAYLTFALYHYLTVTENRSVTVTGVDIKSDVLETCREIAAVVGFAPHLRFVTGWVDAAEVTPSDMVVALHACDTATDDAIVRAVQDGAKIILLAPCCQHELQYTVKNDALMPMLKHGVQRDKFITMVTDTLRALVLEVFGYSVELLEFTSIEHTAKNVLIRAIKNKKTTDHTKVTAWCNQFGLESTYLLKKLGW